MGSPEVRKMVGYAPEGMEKGAAYLLARRLARHGDRPSGDR